MSEINFDAIPGTSHLVDTEETFSGIKAEKKNGIILIPTPSDDPNDPLCWKYSRKLWNVFSLVLYCYGGSVPGCVLYSIITDISKAPGVNISVAQLNQGTGYSFLFLGLGNLFWLPMAEQYGKRPIYLLSMIGVVGFNIWMPYIHENGSWIASRILHGFFYAPIESLPAISIADMFFEHERATYMGVYGVALFSSNYAAPMLAGLVNQAIGWEWTIKIAVIFAAVCTIAMFFFMEETRYDRKLRVTRNSKGCIVTAITSRGEEKNPEVVNTVRKDNSNDLDTCETTADNLANQTSIIEVDDDIEYPPPKTFKEKLSLTGGFQKENHLKDYFSMPFKMLQFPIVLYSGFLYGSSLFFYSILNTTESIVLSGEPYNFSSASCGLAYASAVIFVFICYPAAGWSTDWLKIRFARKHNGVSQAEDRLWILLLYMFLGPSSLILWGVGAAHYIHWFGVIIGLGLMAGLCVIGCVSSVTYTLDCYPQLNMAAMTIVVIIRNTMNFALDYGITPFLDNVGMQNTFIACAFICMFCIGTFFVMMKTGLFWRRKTAHAYWKLIADYRSRGVIS